FRLAEHGAGGGGQLDRGAEPRLGEHDAAGLTVYHADYPIGLGFGALRTQLVEHRQSLLRLLASVLEALPCHVHLGVIDEAESPQIRVADPLGEGAALPEVAVRRVEPSPVRAPHPPRSDGPAPPRVAAALRPGPSARRRAQPRRLPLRNTPSLRADTRLALAPVPHAGSRRPAAVRSRQPYQAMAYSEKWCSSPVTRWASRSSAESRYSTMPSASVV